MEDIQWVEAWTLTKIGDPDAAAPLLEQAIAASPQEKAGGRANIVLVRMWGLVQNGEIAEGLDRALQATHSLPVTPARRRIVGEVLAALPEKARALPAARELRELASPAAV